MKSIYSIIERLESISSRNEKMEILRNEVDNELLKQVFFAALNPHINYFIKKIPEKLPKAPKTLQSLEWALAELNALTARTVTGHAGIDHLARVLSSLNEDDADIIERVIKKDMDCGVDVSTVNKIWKNLIPDYPVMLASQFDEKLAKKWKFPSVVQNKFDGLRVNVIVRGDKVEFRTRNGKLIVLLGEMEEEFVKLSSGLDMVYDGELLVSNGRNGVLPRKEGNGILNKAQKGTISVDEAERVIVKLWDAIPYPHFVAGFSDLEYKNRMVFLMPISTLKIKTNRIAVADTHVVFDMDDVQKHYQAALAAGEEGIILKDMDAPWENKRSKHLMKFKAELECDLKCVEWVEGTGKYEGMLGALVLESADKKVNVSVGSGFNDKQRKNLRKKDCVGKIVAVKYNALIENVKGAKSLFLPIFIELREDKSKADSLKDIK